MSFSSQKELTLTLCRPQEFYECNSNFLRNKIFTFEDFLQHYLDRAGNINYFNYWAGFNLPGHVLEDFFSAFELSKREQDLRKITKKFSKKPYYLIAVKREDKATLKHELVHAHYYLNPSYKQQADVLVKYMRKELRKNITANLKEMGYNSAVIIDEINAYMSTSSYKYLTEELDLDLEMSDIRPFKELAKTVL